MWYQENNLSLNVSKTKDLIVEYRKRRAEQPPINIEGASVEWVEIPRCPHHQQTIMIQTHQVSCEEGTTTPIPPQKTEKIWHGSSDPQVIQLHHREHSDWLDDRLVWQLLAVRPQGTRG